MTWKVAWLERAVGDLAQIWMKSRSRELLQETISDLEDRLSTSPQTCGESRSSDRRVIFIDQIVVDFLVVDETTTALILRIRLRRSN